LNLDSVVKVIEPDDRPEFTPIWILLFPLRHALKVARQEAICKGPWTGSSKSPQHLRIAGSLDTLTYERPSRRMSDSELEGR
jgi:hypothetical protein